MYITAIHIPMVQTGTQNRKKILPYKINLLLSCSCSRYSLSMRHIQMQLTNTHFQSFLFIATISCQSSNVNGISFHLLSTTFSASGVLSHSGNFSGYDSRFGKGTRHSLSTWQILPLPSEASADLLLSALCIHRLCRFHGCQLPMSEDTGLQLNYT